MPSETGSFINTSVKSSNPALMWISICRELLIHMAGIFRHLVLDRASHKP